MKTIEKMYSIVKTKGEWKGGGYTSCLDAMSGCEEVLLQGERIVRLGE
jgi:hypothetical protein